MDDIDILKRIEFLRRQLQRDIIALAKRIGIEAYLFNHSDPIFNEESSCNFDTKVDALANALGYEFESIEAHVIAKKKK